MLLENLNKIFCRFVNNFINIILANTYLIMLVKMYMKRGSKPCKMLNEHQIYIY